MKKTTCITLTLVIIQACCTILNAQSKNTLISILDSEENYVYKNIYLVELRDSSMMVQTSHKYHSGEIKFLKPLTEVNYSQVELIKIGKVKDKGILTGSIIGLSIGLVMGVAICEGTKCNDPNNLSCILIKPPDCGTSIAGSAVVGLLAGALAGIIAQSSGKPPLVIEINKNHKTYLSRKDYLKNYVYKF